MNESTSSDITADGYTIRRLRAADAPGVVSLVGAIYGDSYYPRELYDAGKIVRLNAEEKLVSVVALDSAGAVVGHYALERPSLGMVAEASDALVLPAHRHHHLMEKMRLALRQEGLRLGLTGLVGYPVTNHLFSQLADDHIGAHPCGVALGLWPRTFHNMPEPLPQRMSFAIYFRYLRPPERVVHVVTRHVELTSRICEQHGLRVELCQEAPPSGDVVLSLDYEEAVQAGTIRLRRVGGDSAAAIGRARDQLLAGGARALTLEVPLSQPGAAAACTAAEAQGFFFSGLGPSFHDDGDVLLLQYLVEELDPALVQIENAFAKELLAYVDRERREIRDSSQKRATAGTG